jgi:cytoskeleton protein RodZ
VRRWACHDIGAENLHNWNVGVIGDTLSEARTRRAVDLEQVESVTGIRTRYLRAIEQEDWDALPEEFYARSFIRKYAQFLVVDPEPLVEEYRRQRGTAARAGEAPTSPFATTSSRRADALRRRRRRQEIYTWVGVAALLAAIVVAIVLLSSAGGESGGSKSAGGNGGNGAGRGKGGKAANGKGAGAQGGKAGGNGAGGNGPDASGGAGPADEVTLKIEPTAEVWACVLDAKGKPLIDGLTLAAGETVGPFKSRSYTAAFGNGSVAVTVDGKAAQIPSTPSPLGFTVDHHGRVHQLPEGERPSCE